MRIAKMASQIIMVNWIYPVQRMGKIKYFQRLHKYASDINREMRLIALD